jgi:two-component system chemotaxis response regulator CheB
VRVLIVDDSIVFRSQLKACLEEQPGITVVGSAANGKIAIEKLEQIDCNVVILDMEMPEMNGLEFLIEKAKRGLPQWVIVFAAPTKEGSLQVFQALKAGASDFVAKPSSTNSLEEALEGIRSELLPKILQFKRRHATVDQRERPAQVAPPYATGPQPSPRYPKISIEYFRPKVVAIAASTGGPAALERIFSGLKGTSPSIPILICQHMPPVFTDGLARRLEVVSGIPAAEGRPGEVLAPGKIYVAPGDFHMSLVRAPDLPSPIIKLDQGPKRNSVRPAADPLFESVAREYGKQAIGLVLTGMGEDAREGALAIKRAGGAIMIQDKDSSVVWGMPGAIYDVGCYDQIETLEGCTFQLKRMLSLT